MWEKHSFISSELKDFENYLVEKFQTGNEFLNHVSHAMVQAGGKRIRPALVIMSGMMNEYKREQIFPVAAAVEILHTATLVHDDIVDHAKTRRGQPTVSEIHGINLAVYTGDYLLVSSVLMLAESGLPMEKLEYVAKAARSICDGEVSQYINRFKFTSVRGYLKRAMKKTGVLFAASCLLGGYVSGCDEKQIKMLTRFGMYVGVAFQIRDDLLDVEADEKSANKTVTNDIREGIMTLPFLFAVRNSEPLKEKIKTFFEGAGDVKELMLEVKRAGGNDQARQLKEKYITKCRKILESFSSSPSYSALEELINWI